MEKIRKNLIPVIALVMAVVVFAGYSVTGGGGAAPEKIRIATGGEAGVYSAYGDVLADFLEKRMNITVTAIPSGGAMDNINMLRNGRADIAFVQNDIMSYAYDGRELFSTYGPFKDFYAMAALYPETCQIVARRDIAGIAELAGRRVSIGAEGSGTELNALQILESYGMSDSDINADHLGFSASVAAFREGKIDAFFCTAGVPTPAITELAAGGEARVLSVGDAHARAVISRYPHYSKQLVPKEAYPGIGEEAETVAVKAALAVSAKLGDDTVFEIMKIMFENAAEISKAMPGVEALNRESAPAGLPVPLHPGAEKFFFDR